MLICRCEDEWATPHTYNETGNAADICSAERKSRTTAILLTVLLGGFGAGSFYMDWIVWGIIPFILCCGGCLCMCITQAMCGKTEDGEEGGGKSLGSCVACMLQCACSGLVIATLVWVASENCVSPEGIACFR